MVGINTRGTDCTDAEWSEYCKMSQICDNETSSKNTTLEWIHRCYDSYVPEIGIEKHWATHCKENSFCNGVEQKAIYGYNYDNEYALQQYGIWMQNAIKKIECAREVGRKIQACTIIQRRWLEIFYKPEGMCTLMLAKHYKLLWAVREEMRQINTI
ncbi:31060_t:CDS:2 [Gigaspora margarita]|uniref:31060_t:CDS:1 n=1 Tax=Gigaspora margarita TaxID=4874 RepID=A0ABN7VER0_GIGMA|nr:31060_t:CDS:2 [Gigaspora margarita]